VDFPQPRKLHDHFRHIVTIDYYSFYVLDYCVDDDVVAYDFDECTRDADASVNYLSIQRNKYKSDFVCDSCVAQTNLDLAVVAVVKLKRRNFHKV